jgi:hypothetical protein
VDSFGNHQNTPLIIVTKDSNQYMARLFYVKAEGTERTRYIMLSDNLESIYNAMPPKMTYLLPNDPAIISVWL